MTESGETFLFFFSGRELWKSSCKTIPTHAHTHTLLLMYFQSTEARGEMLFKRLRKMRKFSDRLEITDWI